MGPGRHAGRAARNVVLPIISGNATAGTGVQVSSRAVAFELQATDREVRLMLKPL